MYTFDRNQMKAGNSPLEFYLCLAQTFWVYIEMGYRHKNDHLGVDWPPSWSRDWSKDTIP